MYDGVIIKEAAMKKSALFILVLLGIIHSANFVFAEEVPEMEPQDAQAQEPGGHEGKMEYRKMDKMDHMKMGMMHQGPTVTATSDGGVVVLSGNKLVKYDAALKVVGEVELKGGPAPGEKMRMMKKRRGMENGDGAPETEAPADSDQTAPANATDSKT